MVELPPTLTATTGLDAFTHAIELYVLTTAILITDALVV